MKKVRVSSYKKRDGTKVESHMRSINSAMKKGSNKSSINKNQEAIAIFYNGGYKIFPFSSQDEFLKLKNKYGAGKVIEGQTVKQFIVYESREQKEYPK